MCYNEPNLEEARGTFMEVEIALYGKIARAGGGKHVAVLTRSLPTGSRIRDVLAALGLQPEEVGLIFVNSVLSDLPGLHIALDDELHAGDHLGLFAADYIWPYQYRDGTVVSPRLREAIATGDYLHHHPRGRWSET